MAQLLSYDEQFAKADAWVLCADAEVEIEELHQFLHESSSDTARNVIKKEFLRSPNILYYDAKHPKCKHIEKDVRQIGVQELVSDELEEVELAGHEEVESTDGWEVDSPELKNPRCYERQEVDDEQVLGDGGYVAEHGCN